MTNHVHLLVTPETAVGEQPIQRDALQCGGSQVSARPGAGDQKNLPKMPLASMENKRDWDFDDEIQGEMNVEK